VGAGLAIRVAAQDEPVLTLTWRVRPTDDACVARLRDELHVRPLTAAVLAARGLCEPAAAARFLAPRLADLRPPDGIADLDRALDRLVSAVTPGECVGVFGDYDVDGVTTAAILTITLRAFGAQVVARVARRSSGYGLSPAAATHFLDQGCTLVVTGDCGTSDGEAIAICRARGVDVIVIDHHHVPSGPSTAYALLNPHRSDDKFPFKGLASCGVAFYLAAALRTRLRAQASAAADGFDPREVLDLVALGTVADMVPLRDENRILASIGLRDLAAFRRPGLRALSEIAGVELGSVLASDVSFRLAPRLNAAGRLGDAQVALDLLLASDAAEASRLAGELDDMNRQRQRIQEQMWGEALRAAEEFPNDAALVLGAEGWHQGVVGIVAAKLVDKFRKPVVVVGFKDGSGRGSARTIGGLDLYQSLAACQQHLTVFGGHAAAAGLGLLAAQMGAFRASFVAEAQRHFDGRAGDPALEVDAVADLGDLDLVQAEELERLAPFGAGNSEPLFVLPGVVARSTRVVGTSHLQITLSRGAAVSQAIAFGMADRDPGEGAQLDVIGTAEVDNFRGNRRARVRVKQLLRRTS
jgi:single-stranded-DNA-specific exonuclease